MLAAAVAVAALGACDNTPAAAPPAPVAASSAAAPGSPGTFGGTDLAWIEITIAMDEELLPLLALVPSHGADPGLKELSAQLSEAHQGELVDLRALHDRARLPDENPHKGMPMPGMVTPEQVAEATAVRGAAFDTLVVRHLTAHLQQGVKLAESEGKSGVEPQTRALAERVIDNRRDWLTQAKKYA
ncbi:DUF305 domain-containing protein [Actinoplanes sp. NPDC049548]|uniref:DUF305 domain-containing protein n=1 Tax=Actinoplanes sp. NPDC049548 TaxID=3155152 RepID=UPI00343EAA7E